MRLSDEMKEIIRLNESLRAELLNEMKVRETALLEFERAKAEVAVLKAQLAKAKEMRNAFLRVAFPLMAMMGDRSKFTRETITDEIAKLDTELEAIAKEMK